MRFIFVISVLLIVTACEKGFDSSGKLPLCKETIKGKFGYFDNCRTVKYQGSGYSYSGTWKNNKFHGSGYYKVDDVKYIVQDFNMGKKNGIVIVSHPTYSWTLEYKDGELIESSMPVSKLPIDYGNSSLDIPISIDTPSRSYPKDTPSISYPNFNLGGNSKKKITSPNIPSYTESYSYTQTVSSNRNCPLMGTPLRKQEVRNGNRICYY